MEKIPKYMDAMTSVFESKNPNVAVTLSPEEELRWLKSGISKVSGEVYEDLIRQGKICYLIAQKTDEVGCIALETTHGKHLSDFKRRMEEKVGYEKIQLVTISRPSAYGEYEPYHFVNSKEEFAKAVEMMAKKDAWKFSKGIVMMDGVPPSDEVLTLAEQEIRGEITTDDMKEYLRRKYDAK